MRSFILAILLFSSAPAFSKEAILKKITATIDLKNESQDLSISVTGVNTFLVCNTFYRSNGEGFSDANSVEPYPDATISFSDPLSPGETKPMVAVFNQEYHLNSPSRFWYRSQDCELGLNLSLDLVSKTTEQKIAINNFYGFGIDVNRGFPLLNTKDSGLETLTIDKDFPISLSFRVDSAGTRYSPKEGKRVPYCTLNVYRLKDQKKIGFNGTDVPCPRP